MPCADLQEGSGQGLLNREEGPAALLLSWPGAAAPRLQGGGSGWCCCGCPKGKRGAGLVHGLLAAALHGGLLDGGSPAAGMAADLK